GGRSTLQVMVRKRFTFRGTVQGVGFRPAVYRFAVSMRLTGFVQNMRSEVVVEAQGDEDQLSRFAAGIAAAMPPAARVEAMIVTTSLPRSEETGFLIMK